MSTEAIRLELWDIAPELQPADGDTNALEKVDRFIVRAQRYVAREVAGAEYGTLVAYKTADMMTKAELNTLAKQVQDNPVLLKEKVGQAEYTYADRLKQLQEAQGVYASEFEDRMSVLCVGGFITSNGSG